MGTKLHYALSARPPASSPPLVVLLHGSGADENDLLPLSARLGPACGGALVASLRGPIMRGPGFAWFEGSSADPAPSALERGIAQSAERVMSFIEEAPRKLDTDPNRTYLFGFSQGATIGWSILASRWPRASLLAGAVLLSGRLMPEARDPTSAWGRRLPPAEAAELASRPHVFAAHGSRDMITPFQFGRQTLELARSAGLDESLTWLEHKSGHDIPAEALYGATQTLAQAAAAVAVGTAGTAENGAVGGGDGGAGPSCTAARSDDQDPSMI